MHNPPHQGSHTVLHAFWLLAVTIVAADIWPEAWTSLNNLVFILKSPSYAEASPTFDNTQSVASITQDNSKNSKTVGGRALEVGDRYVYGFLNIHLSSAGYIGIAFSIVVAIIILAFFCSARCKKRWRRNEQVRRRELTGEAPPEGDQPREPGILRALARRISNPQMNQRTTTQLQQMDMLHRMERMADRLNVSQTDKGSARKNSPPSTPYQHLEEVKTTPAEIKTTPVPAERRTAQERRTSQDAVVERARETAFRLALAGVPAKQIIPRVIAEAREGEAGMI